MDFEKKWFLLEKMLDFYTDSGKILNKNHEL